MKLLSVLKLRSSVSEPGVDVPMGYTPPRRNLGLLIVLLALVIVLTFVITGVVLLITLAASHSGDGLHGPKGKEGRGPRAAPLTISVYYETLCPDSRRFIITQLHPLFTRLGGLDNGYFDIDYVPYGKANTTELEDGSLFFQCQHGPRECEGNRVHACALAHLPPEAHSSFIACSMTSSDPPSAGPACAWLHNQEFGPVDACFGAEGPQLLATLGERTHALEPELYYVPWITHNGQWTVEDLNDSQADLLTVVCRKLRQLGAPTPSDCPPA